MGGRQVESDMTHFPLRIAHLLGWEAWVAERFRSRNRYEEQPDAVQSVRRDRHSGGGEVGRQAMHSKLKRRCERVSPETVASLGETQTVHGSSSVTGALNLISTG